MTLIITQKTMYKYKNTLKYKLDFWSFLMPKSYFNYIWIMEKPKKLLTNSLIIFWPWK
jgi:hypothetical protein